MILDYSLHVQTRARRFTYPESWRTTPSTFPQVLTGNFEMTSTL
jgi:hypothetical protein